MTDQQDEEDPRPGVLPIGFGGLAAMAILGAREDGDVTEGDPRLKDLPDFENDHLRGTDGSDGEATEVGNP